MKIQKHLEKLIHAEDLDTLKQASLLACREIGFDYFSLSAIIEDDFGANFVHVTHQPEINEEYFKDVDSFSADPISAHIKHHGTPLIWSRDNYIAADEVDMWEETNQSGISCGISMAVHLPRNEHLAIGFASGEKSMSGEKDTQKQLSDFQLFSIYALEVSRALIFPLARSIPIDGASVIDALSLRQVDELPGDKADIQLTAKELEHLKWTADGKTAWEIGAILGTSEGTVSKSLQRAYSKLGSQNKFGACVQAFRMKLIC